MKPFTIMVPVLAVAGLLYLVFPERHPMAPVKAAASLADTQVDGAVGSRYRMSAALKARFDYWLSAVGELPLSALPEQLAQSLRQDGWAEADIKAALAAFAHYQQYLDALSEVAKPQAATAAELKAAWAERDALRRQFYSDAEIKQLWGDEAAVEDFTLRRLEIQSLGLSEGEKLKWEEDALAQAPATVQQAYGPSLTLAQLQQMNGASRDQLAAQYGDGAADRLMAAKAQQQAWQGKVAAYRDKVKSLAALPSAEKAQALAEYQARHFSANELKRLRVWLSNGMQ